MVSEPRKQSMAWVETDYSKHTPFWWKIKWRRLEHLGALGIMGEIVLFTRPQAWVSRRPLRHVQQCSRRPSDRYSGDHGTCEWTYDEMTDDRLTWIDRRTYTRQTCFVCHKLTLLRTGQVVQTVHCHWSSFHGRRQTDRSIGRKVDRQTDGRTVNG